MAAYFQIQSLLSSFCLFLMYIVHRTNCEEHIINSLEILESLSQLALLRHHPQSIYSNSNNMTESFFSLLEDLRNQNLTENHANVNCSSLSQFPMIPKGLCNDGALFKVCIALYIFHSHSSSVIYVEIFC